MLTKKNFGIILFILLLIFTGCASAVPPQIPAQPEPATVPQPLVAEDKSQPVPVVPPPVIHYFQAKPSRIGTGTATVLSWFVADAITVFLDNDIGNVPQTGTIEINPMISTTYTLTAINEGGAVTTTTGVIVVPAKVGLPVVTLFAADPGNITSGTSSLLRWQVNNADDVEITPDVGLVEPIGSATVNPDRTTSYTLSAYNGVGIVIATTQLIVTTEPASGRPDLVITGINKVETESGVKIGYTLKNQGTNDSPPSTTRLYANGIYQALDSLEILHAGTSITRTVTGWYYNPATSVIKVSLDADNNVIENDESNNSLQLNIPVQIGFDFIENAAGATWGEEYPYKQLKFGAKPEENEAMASYRTETKMEDGSLHERILETRPKATVSGLIRGDYDNNYTVVPGDHFYGLAGLVEGSIGGEVQFQVFIRNRGGTDWEALVENLEDIFDYRIKSVSARIPAYYFGKEVEFSLRVSAGNNYFQDWAAWVDAKIIR